MKKGIMLLLTVIVMLCVSACGGSKQPPITSAKVGMTKDEILVLEPELVDTSRAGMMNCKRSYGSVEGWLFVTFETTEAGEVAKSVGWDAWTTEDGKKLYKALLTDLKACYGKPDHNYATEASEYSSVETMGANWRNTKFTGRLSFSHDLNDELSNVYFIAGIN